MRVKDLTSKWLILVSIFTFSLFCLCRRYQLSTLYEKYTNAANGGTLYNGDYWKEYRIGDLYRFGKFVGCGKKNPGCKDDDYHNIHFPKSIAHYYSIFNNPKKRTNEKAMHLAIKKVNSNHNIDNIDCCFHIRTGDVINISDKTAKKYSRKGDVDWWIQVVKWLKQQNIKTITIMSGSHTLDDQTKSLQYIFDRKAFLEQNGFRVNLRLGKSPDEDILTAYNSNYFVSTGGTYGKLMKSLSALNNTRTLPDYIK